MGFTIIVMCSKTNYLDTLPFEEYICGMKILRLKYLAVLLVISASLLFGNALLAIFQAHSDGNDIIVEWQTTQENNLKEFVVQRRTANSDFIDLDKVKAKGSNSYYSYRDESAYKTTGTLYIYRLKIVDNDNTISYSAEVSVSHNVSSVKRTWGSIKALFR